MCANRLHNPIRFPSFAPLLTNNAYYMKTILKTILLLAVLCLAGCSSEDPQSVAFSVKEIAVGPDATRMSIIIEANCPWTVTDEKDKTFTEIKQGSGTVETPFIVFTNPDYETKQYTVTVTSEDGTSTDVLTVTQGEAFGMEAGKAELVAAEGGTIDIPVRTNDQVDDVETPDWITFTSSRALTGYTYTFTAEPNKTGSPRTGYISLKGKNHTDSRIEVKQDSYAPTSASIPELPKYAFTGEAVTLDIVPEPEYADDAKLSVKVLYNGKEMKSTYENRKVQFTTGNRGEYTLEFYEGKTLIGSETLDVYDDKVYMQLDCKETCLVGDTINVSVDIPMDMCTIEASAGKEVLKKIDETTYAVTGEGSFTFTATNKLTGYKDKKIVNSKFVLSQSRVECKTSLSEGKMLATFHTEVVSNSVMEYVDYRIFSPDGYLVMEKNAFVTYNWTSILFKSFEMPVSKGKHTIWITVKVDGKIIHNTSYATVQ